MPRLFVAIRPPPVVREQLSALMHGLAGARWQSDDQLHLTLRFVGEVELRTADDIAAALADVRARRLDLMLAGVGAFERKGRVDTLWAGVAPLDALTALHRKLDHALVRLDLAPEGRSYRPHITIARFGRNAPSIDAFLAAHAALASAPFTADAFHLFESDLAGDGPRYPIAATYPLA